MSDSGGERPKDPKRRNVFSFVDRSEKKKREEGRKGKNAPGPSDLIDYSVFDDPDKVRRKSLVIKAGQMLETLKADPSLSREAITEARKQLPNNFSAISYLIMNFKHQQLIDEPNRFWAILDIFFEPLDKLARTVTDQFSAELDIMTRFKPKNFTQEDWARVSGAPIDSMSEEPSFQESFARSVNRVKIMQTPNVVELLDEYTRSEWGPGAPYLLALLNEYKKRRTFGKKGE